MTWEQSWREGRTGWDAGEAAPPLLDLIESGVLPEGRALVPGCGSGYDVFALARSGREVIGLDIAPTATERFESLRCEQGIESARIELGDFFTMPLPTPIEMVWDYTFLCAIDPTMRAAWARRMGELIAPGGELVTLIFPVRGDAGLINPPTEEHPPYPLHPERVEALVAPYFERVALFPAARSHPGREGLEWVGRWRRRR